MNAFNPVVYEQCRSAWENYRREEDLPVQSLPAQVPETIEAGAAGRLIQALRSVLALRKPAPKALQSGVALKSVAR